MDRPILNPFIRFAGAHRELPIAKENSVCLDCRLFAVLRGEGALYRDEKKYYLRKGSIVYLPAGTTYKLDFPNNEELLICVINFDLTWDFSHLVKSQGTPTESEARDRMILTTESFSELCEPIFVDDAIDIRGNIERCVKLYLDKTENYRQYAEAYLKLSLLDLLDRKKSAKDDYKLVSRVQEYVRANYGDPELTNEGIADEFGYHPYYVSRLMKHHTGRSLKDYIIEYRLHMAKTYLTTSSLNITEISKRVGFASYTYFIKLFRERIGQPPLTYRQSHRSQGI